MMTDENKTDRNEETVNLAIPREDITGMARAFEFRHIIMGSQPIDNSIHELKTIDGITQAFNLRNPEEADNTSIKETCSDLGIEYHEIPVLSPTGLSTEALNQITEKVKSPSLVFCASGNRVGAWLYFKLRKEGLEIEQAAEIARSAGLTNEALLAAAEAALA